MSAPTLRLWVPLDEGNSLINGRRADLHPELWRALRWEHAQFHRLPGAGTVLKVPGARALSHVVSPDRLALALEAEETAVPMPMPSFADLPRITATGFLWLVVPRAGIRPAPVPRQCPPVPIPAHQAAATPWTPGAPFGDQIGG